MFSAKLHHYIHCDSSQCDAGSECCDNQQAAHDWARSNDWHLGTNGKHYCPECAAPLGYSGLLFPEADRAVIVQAKPALKGEARLQVALRWLWLAHAELREAQEGAAEPNYTVASAMQSIDYAADLLESARVYRLTTSRGETVTTTLDDAERIAVSMRRICRDDGVEIVECV